MARPTDIIQRFVLSGLSGVVSTSRRIETTIRSMASRAGAATVDLSRRAGQAVRRQFASVASASVAEAQRRIAQATRGLKDLTKATAKVSFSALEKGAKASFAAVGLAATAAAAKVAALTTAAITATKTSADSLSSLDLTSQQTGVGIPDLAALTYASQSQGTGPDALLSSLQAVASTIREIERGLDSTEGAVARARRFLQLGIPYASRAGDADSLTSLIDTSKSAGMASLDSVEWRMRRLEQKMQSIRSGRIASMMADSMISNGADTVGIAAFQRRQSEMLTPLLVEYQQLVEASKALRESMGPAGRALEDLKAAGLDANRAMSGGADALMEIAGALEQIEGKAKKTEIVRGLFGDTTHLPVLLQGRAGVARYRAEMERYGGVETQADGERSSRLKSSELVRDRAIEGTKLEIAREVSPLLEETNRQFANWLAKNRQTIAQYVKETFIAVRAVIYDVGKLLSGSNDFDTALFKKSAALIEWSKKTYTTIKQLVVAVASEVYGEFAKIFSGMDSNWGWLNKLRDAFLAVKSFATDAFAVLSGGQAQNFTWLNDLVATAKSFFAHLQEAWGMFRRVLDTIHQTIKPVLSFFNTDVLTAALFVGMLRLSGILGGILAVGRGLLGVFTPALAGIGAAAAATAGQIGLIAAALLSAWKLGEWIGGKLAEPIVAKYNGIQEQTAKRMRETDAAYMSKKLATASLDERVGLMRNMGLNTYGRKTRAEQLAERDKTLKTYNGGIIRADGSAELDPDKLYASAKRWSNKTTLNFNIGGKSFGGLFQDSDADGLVRELKQKLRID